ncbi:MAG: hypothetical protein IPQ24_03610 [Anaeromyxobacter sp.]|nr:hypothetical protein [Anaeromyxobacter sp.]
MITRRAARRLLLLAAPALLAGCVYDFKNPAEVLRAGEATGRVLADRTATGALDPFPGVSVSLKGAVFDQTTHETGRFALLDLPVGRHTLLFRRGTAWSLERDVEIAFGKDGQPEGVDVGVVVLRYAAAVEGIFGILPGNALAGGVVVDERTGLTALLQPVPASPHQATFRFPSLGAGAHLLKVGATDALGGRWVGGQAPVTVAEADQVQVAAGVLAGRVASAGGRVRFRVQEVGDASVVIGAVTATLVDGATVLGPFGQDSQGFIDETVPEGAWQIVLSGGGLASAPAVGPASRLAAALPGSPLRPPAATAVVLSGQVAEVGSLYVVSDLAVLQARLACAAPDDCGGQACSAGSCQDYAPPDSGNAGAGVPFCASCAYIGQPQACQAGPGVVGLCTCADPDPTSPACRQATGAPLPGRCLPPCTTGLTCTSDGVRAACDTGVLP